MAFPFAEQRQARRAAKVAAEEADSPVGRARIAQQRGDAFLQIELEDPANAPDVLGSIEAIGWRLAHAGYTAADAGVAPRGIYLFRRAGKGVKDASTRPTPVPRPDQYR